jgi:hypothetical protein
MTGARSADVSLAPGQANSAPCASGIGRSRVGRRQCCQVPEFSAHGVTMQVWLNKHLDQRPSTPKKVGANLLMTAEQMMNLNLDACRHCAEPATLAAGVLRVDTDAAAVKSFFTHGRPLASLFGLQPGQSAEDRRRQA